MKCKNCGVPVMEEASYGYIHADVSGNATYFTCALASDSDNEGYAEPEEFVPEHPTEFSKSHVLPKTASERKQVPIATGVIDYFPDAIAAVAHTSWAGNEQHHPGTPLHWDRSKSTDEADALMRHFVQRGTLDSDGIRHSAKVAWRALALLQKEIEAEAKNQTSAPE